ncbi:IucA/IucC family protein [Streptomyces monomycini]|uniref:IucA/IucC family protein n=1 Tax=Streptomyces monomycini TaxID=371720 RepID=UPI0004AB983C|nr:IucA/IucC family protein [Streptomyces monomycini]
MNERPGPDGTPADERRLPREPLARLREPAVPRQNRRAGAHDSGENGEHGGHTGCAVRLGHHERHGLEDCHGLGATRVVTVYGDDETDTEIDAEPPAGGAHENAARQSPAHDGPAPEGTDPVRAPAQDRLEHQDPAVAADAAGAESLLRCWIRESGTPRPAGNRLRLPLDASAAILHVPVLYWSETGWHRLGAPTLEGTPADAAPLDAVTLAALLRREAVRGGAGDSTDSAPGSTDRGSSAPASTDSVSSGPASTDTVTRALTSTDDTGTASLPTPLPSPRRTTPHRTAPGHPGGTPDSESADLVGRVADSVRHTAVFLADRRAAPADDLDTSRFLAAEQALLLGHPMHPTPKSREGLTDAETRAYSPELRGAFRLHWTAVHQDVFAAASAWTERGRTVPAEQLAARLAEGAPQAPAGTLPLPMHPWQAHQLGHRPDIAEMYETGHLHDLGPGGPAWHPTSSVRTVFRPGRDAMLKLSLGVRITNSRRDNLRKELERGVEVHRLLRTGLAAQWRAAFPGPPGFDIVRDPAWFGVTGAGGEPVHGLDVVVRHNPFDAADDAVCIAALTSPRPWPGRTGLRSRLADVIGRLTARTGRPAGAVATEWFLRYLEAVVRPVLWLDGTAGVALEAHQQNTLVLLDRDGWPAGGRYRDNQGYYFRESRRTELERRLPGIGSTSDTFVTDEVTDERFAYYLGINNVLGLIGAFGSQRLAAEKVLLAAFRRFLTDAATGPAEHRSPLPGRLLEARTLRCKANLLTRLRGLDELVGPVDTQSVYVTIPNPLHP